VAKAAAQLERNVIERKEKERLAQPLKYVCPVGASQGHFQETTEGKTL